MHRSITAAAVLLASGIGASAHADPVEYDLTIIADTTGAFSSIASQARASIGDNGVVLFSARVNGAPSDLYTWHNGTLTNITPGDASIGRNNGISADGRVIAWMQEDPLSGQTVVRRLRDGTFEFEYDVLGDPAPTGVLANNDGTTAFAQFDSWTRVDPVGNQTSFGGFFDDVSNISGMLAMNESGDVAFIAQKESVPGSQIWKNAGVIVPRSVLIPSKINCTVRNDGKVVVTAREPDQVSGLFIVDADGSYEAAITPSPSIFNSVSGEGSVSVNASNHMALNCKPSAEEASGVWVIRPDGSRSLAIRSGADVTIDGQVFNFDLSGNRVMGTRSLNNHGQVVATALIGADQYLLLATPRPITCPGDIANDFGSLDEQDGMVSFGDFLALLGLVGPCPGGTPGCTGDIADDFGTLGPNGQVSFGDFLALLGLVGPCP